MFNRLNELSVDYEHVIICGDFNANKFDNNKYSKLWALSDYMNVVNDDCPTYIAENFNPSQLDLIFTKNTNDIKHFGHFPAIGISNHQAIYGIFNTFTTKKEVKTFKIRNFNNITESQIEDFASRTDWTLFSYNQNIDYMINQFYSIMNIFLDEICPIKTIISKHKPVSWMTNEIKDLMNQRKKFYDWWKSIRKH